MKRIKNIHQLNQEKQRIQLRRAELEHTLQHDWNELKESMSPGKIVQRAMNQFLGKTDTDENKIPFDRFIKNPVVKQGLNIALSLLVERVVKRILKRKPKDVSE